MKGKAKFTKELDQSWIFDEKVKSPVENGRARGKGDRGDRFSPDAGRDKKKGGNGSGDAGIGIPARSNGTGSKYGGVDGRIPLTVHVFHSRMGHASK